MLRLAKRWIAGENLKEALSRAKDARSRGLKPIINILGEHLKEKKEVEKVKKEYMMLIDRLAEEGLGGGISVKPSQLGMDIERTYCRENLHEIAKKAGRKGIFLWLDMEGSAYTQATIDFCLELNKYGIGVALQAYLRRSEVDLRTLLKEGVHVRLVKGAYKEPRGMRLASNSEIRENFKRLMRVLFQEEVSFAIATHDKELIEEAKKLSAGKRERFEFQMLTGIGEGLKEELMNDGYEVAEYMPYGKNWLPYALRRVRERKENIFLLLKAIIGRS